MIPYHKCTEQDWALFSETARGMGDKIAMIRDNPKRGMYCLDETQELEIYGTENNMNYQRVEILFVPCNYLHEELGYTEDSVYKDCVADLDKQVEYLGPLNWKVYHTQ